MSLEKSATPIRTSEVFICTACGTSYPAAGAPPDHCPICDDERQFIPLMGQAWTTPRALGQRHVNAWRQLEPDLFQIHSQPTFAIGERALLLRTPAGNVLWDCMALIDDATVALIRALGGLKAIAISHPHYYTTMQDWAHAFDCPVHLHAADRRWVMRPDPALRFWEGETHEVLPGATLLRLGGHFAGGTVLHWADGDGALLTGDIVQVAVGAQRVSFLWSYPNMLPLSAGKVRGIAETLAPWKFERVYGAFPGRDVRDGGSAMVARSAERYAELLGEV